MRALSAIPIVIGILAAGCSDEDTLRAELAQVQAALAEATKAKAAVDAELDRVKAKLTEVETENTALKQTPRYFFHQAVALMQASSDDAGDEGAIAAFTAIVDRFPDDPLAKAAGTKLAELKHRVAERARRLVQAQAEVRRLIESCRRNATTANEISNGGMHFTFGGAGPLDMNRAMAASRRAESYRREVEAAVEKAQALLRDGVPDPGGKLADELGRYNGFE